MKLKLQDLQLQSIYLQSIRKDNTLGWRESTRLFHSATDGSLVDSKEVRDLKRIFSDKSITIPEHLRYVAKQIKQQVKSFTFRRQFLSPYIDGTKQPGKQWTNSSTGYSYPITYKDFPNTPVSNDTTSPSYQGYFGTCTFLSASYGLQSYSMVANPNNTYSFKFFRDGKPTWVTVNREIPTTNGGELMGVRSGSGDRYEVADLTMSLGEKAYALFRQQEQQANGWNIIGNGNYPEETIEDLTGRNAVETHTAYLSFPKLQSILSISKSYRLPIIGSTHPRSTNLVPASHAYSVVDAFVENGIPAVSLRNPWGFDGLFPSGNPDDGIITIPWIKLSHHINTVSYVE